MDRILLINYEKDFRIEFLESKGDAFQRLFEKLMSNLYPGDFIACRPWGKTGDRKNDGYLRSKRILFQVYAPNEITAREAIHKIREDFSGAKEYWKEYFDEWIFIHNCADGRLHPDIIEELLNLERNNPQVKVSHWGYTELMIEFRKLKIESLESWYGKAFTTEDKMLFGYAELEAVLHHVVITPEVSLNKIKEVPPRKIEYNKLSNEVSKFLKIGMEKAPLVDAFFSNWKNPTYGNNLAHEFKKQYAKLREQEPTLHPDLIFGKLEQWAGGTVNTSPKHKAAVLAVLAYFFDSCDIFEEPLGISHDSTDKTS